MPEGVEALLAGQEEVQAGVLTVVEDPGHSRPDARENVPGFQYVVPEQGEAPLRVGLTVEGTQRNREVSKPPMLPLWVKTNPLTHTLLRMKGWSQPGQDRVTKLPFA